MTNDTPVMTLLGSPAVRAGNRRQKLPFAGQTRRLFVYLAGHANLGVRRDCLLEELWTDIVPSKATSNLNTAIWRIKHGLNPIRGFAIESVDGVVRLEVSEPATIDCHVLESSVAEAAFTSESAKLTDGQYERLLKAVENCKGPFLDGYSDHWVLPLREKFAALHIRALTILMRDRAACGHYDAALEFGNDILRLDSFREGIQREVMWLYALNGQRAQAIVQFRRLSDLLAREMGIEPMPETIALHGKIVHTQDTIARLARHSLKEGWLDPLIVPAVVPAVYFEDREEALNFG